MRDLFEASAQQARSGDPLAERMRPRVLEAMVGQPHVLGEGKLLQALVAKDQIPSMILWGPPGSGKTTLARIIAGQSKARLQTLSAVMAGVPELRVLLKEADRARGEFGARTILFVDEIHRWSKAQQDALLPAVERGVVTLIGATTENPSFALNSALLSRCRVFVLEALDETALRTLLTRALEDSEHGLGALKLTIEPDALDTIVSGAHGDARRALTTLEVAAQHATGAITRSGAEEALQHRALLYDRAGDAHYGVVSAFIKALRGSDPDAAIYYLVRMLESGEEPRFLIRRMVIFASEDVGNADPQALQVAVAAGHAFELMGLPEGVLPLTQAASYLALAPKSGAVIKAYGAARRDVREHGPLPVPKKLLNAPTGLSKQLGHGEGYKYPHDFGGIVPGETYLPEALTGRIYYQPTDNGFERVLAERQASWRRAAEESED